MHDEELDALIKVVRKAARGETITKKAECYRSMKAIAKRLARDGETGEQSFVRLFTKRDSPGFPVFAAYMARGDGSATTHIAKSVPSSDGDGVMVRVEKAFVDQVNDHMVRHPTMKRSHAIDHVARSATGASAYAAERDRRLCAALGY